jgi:hypothetical protein
VLGRGCRGLSLYVLLVVEGEASTLVCLLVCVWASDRAHDRGDVAVEEGENPDVFVWKLNQKTFLFGIGAMPVKFQIFCLRQPIAWWR